MRLGIPGLVEWTIPGSVTRDATGGVGLFTSSNLPVWAEQYPAAGDRPGYYRVTEAYKPWVRALLSSYKLEGAITDMVLFGRRQAVPGTGDIFVTYPATRGTRAMAILGDPAFDGVIALLFGNSIIELETARSEARLAEPTFGDSPFVVLQAPDGGWQAGSSGWPGGRPPHLPETKPNSPSAQVGTIVGGILAVTTLYVLRKRGKIR